MCGLAGAVGHLDATLIAAVQRAAAAQVHRGPDDEGFWQSASPGRDGVLLAFRRLAIVDLSADGHQPMVDARTGNVLVFNGEIYNFRELRAELAALGHAFRSQSDTEVLLTAYAEWGTDALRRLRGMFGFALWDARARRLVLARDRIGIKPLFHCTIERPHGRTLLFASELRALLATGLVARRLSRAAIGSYVWNGFVAGPQTIIDGVGVLPAGTFATWAEADGRLKEQRYWQLPAARPAADGIDRLRHELHTAVQQHLNADVPVGMFLSGGIDSSAITNLAARTVAPHRRLRTFTIGFDETTYDEAPHAERVAMAIGTEHTTVRLTQRRFTDQLDTALRSIDQPTFDGINSWFVSRAVRDVGITVALSGAGGDELFGGYHSFRDVPRVARLGRRTRRVPERVLRLVSNGIAAFAGGRRRAVGPQSRWGKLADALAARGDLVGVYQVCHALFTTAFSRRLLADDGDTELRCGLPRRRFAELAAMVDGTSALHAVSLLEMANFVGERLVRDIDAASMAASLETRVPLLDHVVVEAAAGVADHGRFAPLGRKMLLRELALTGLRRDLFDRPKAGFVLPIELWVRRALAAEVGRTLCDRARCEAVGLDVGATAALWNAWSAGVRGLYWSRVWAIYVLLWWAREHRVSL
jgi:asparagine synthase (glutamine-hydrolysing)